ncbi:MAG: glucosamine-6-phosphate deaminase [Flavobacteriaceae bacterium]
MKRILKVENLEVQIYPDRNDMGHAAADYVQKKIKDTIDKQGHANVILATGSSQFSFLKALVASKIEWEKVVLFHLDEYYGISDSHPASFRRYLKERVLDHVTPKKMYFLNGDADDIEAEMNRYENALKKHPIDIACIGIGENGHIAFNDPSVADFKDSRLVKFVKLDEACRNQQYEEGWFQRLEDVPKEALTLTIPAILRSKVISCVVSDDRKAKAVHDALYGKKSTECPASILRTHPEITMFLDNAAASKIDTD